jgi:hypothetical protein
MAMLNERNSRHSGVWIAVFVASAWTLCTGAVAADDIKSLFSNGTFLLNARYRYESVQQMGFAKEAVANTIRVRAGFETAKQWDVQALVELVATEQLSNAFNDTVNGRTAYPVISDPENLALNRLQIHYTGLPGTALTVGRQVINLDDQRFVGAGAFRQNEQTFDAVRLTNTSIVALTLNYIYVDQVNRVFGERSSQGHFRGDVHLFNAAYSLGTVGKIVAYAYLLGLDNAPALSTQTYGAAFSGKRTIDGDLSVRYLAEAATQHPYANNTGHFGLTYLRGEIEFDYGPWSALGGVENLQGNGNVGFATPLATLHKFQGSADVFLTTPANGIVDVYGKLGTGLTALSWGPIKGASLSTWYHDYRNSHGSPLGSEIDLEGSVSLNHNLSLTLAYATYNGVPGFADRDKVWLAAEFAL